MRWERMEIYYEIERNEKDMVEDIQMDQYLGGRCDEG